MMDLHVLVSWGATSEDDDDSGSDCDYNVDCTYRRSYTVNASTQ